VTDRSAFDSGENSVEIVLERIRIAAGAGADWIQIRQKDLQGRILFRLVENALLAARSREGTPAKVIVNDRLDVAVAAPAAGVHLGHASLPVADVIRWCRSGNAPADFLVGVSCHSAAEVREAETAGASYVFFGPVFETPSKRHFGAPQGIAKLAEACQAVRIPVLAIGGVNSGNAAECVRAGAAGVAAIREFQVANDGERARNFVRLVHGSR
jgi:thiamine-phosphate pyrophosphorylase